MSMENESPENMYSDLMSPDQLSPEKRSDSPDYRWTFKPGTNWGFVFLFMSHQRDEGGGSIFPCVSWEGLGQEHSEWVIYTLKSFPLPLLFTLTLFLFLIYLFVHFHLSLTDSCLLDAKLSDYWSLLRTQNKGSVFCIPGGKTATPLYNRM